MIVDWTEEEMDLIEKWTEKKPGLPIKDDCPPEIKEKLKELIKLMRVEERNV